MLVVVGPGATAFTQILLEDSWTAPLRSRPLQPFFAAVYAILANTPLSVAHDDVITMLPFGFDLLEDVMLMAWEPYFRARNVPACMTAIARWK